MATWPRSVCSVPACTGPRASTPGPGSGFREVDGEPHVGVLLLIAPDVLDAGEDPDAHPDGVVLRAEDGPPVPVVRRDFRHEQVVDAGDDPVIRLPSGVRR